MSAKTRIKVLEKKLQRVEEAEEEVKLVFEPTLICRHCYSMENEGERARCPLKDGAKTCPGMVST